MDIETLMGADPSEGRVAMIARVALHQGNILNECPTYLAALEQALKNEPPPFDTLHYSHIYREASKDVRWMAVSLMTNAEREGDGAKRLWSLASCSDNTDEQLQLKTHAVDESRHAIFYLTLLDLTFPTIVSPSFRQELDKLSPGFLMKQKLAPIEGSPYAKKPTIDDFLQMNIAEIRTTIHHLLQRPAIAWHSPSTLHRRIASVQNALLHDELRHVSYTANLIEQRARNLSFEQLSGLFRKRFSDFNQITTEELGATAFGDFSPITTEELGATVFDCSVACCSKRPWCRAKA